jgi:hypothetical protein
MRYLSATFCALFLLGCTQPTKVIVKTVVVEKPGRQDMYHHQCPIDIAKWQNHCAAIKSEADCNAEQMCHWHGKSQMRCQRYPCKDQGLPWPR